MAGVRLEQLVKRFGSNEVVCGIDLDVKDNEFLVLVGPSGCGKSTILRLIAGLEDITAGQIFIGNKLINELAPKDRDIAMVFQDYALYPHLDVFRNMSFGLEMKKISKNEIQKRVEAAAKILNIEGLLKRKPKQLSGGQRQRVAMGRAIVRNPNVFLFDEPLSNLDAKLRTQMRTEIKKLHQTVETTIIYVTHDQVEAMTLAERIVVMKDGNIIQVGTPDEVYNHPKSIFVAGFIGAPTMNFVPCKLLENNGKPFLELPDTAILEIPENLRDRYRSHLGKEVILGIRPEYFKFTESGNLSLKVTVKEPLGSSTLYFFEIGSSEIVANLPPQLGFSPGEIMPLEVDMNKMHLFNPETEKLI